MTEIVLDFATRQIRRTFERAIGKSVPKILTELITNSDDSYRRLAEDVQYPQVADPAPITIVFDRSNKRFSVIDNAEGITDAEMEERFAMYGKESVDRRKGYKTRSLFGKGLRDVLFTQKHGQVKSIKNDLFYNCRFRWKDSGGQERPVLEIKPPSRVTPELRRALNIPKNGTLVEFTLRQDVHNPLPEKLLEALGRFYMLRFINSSPHREVMLRVIRKGETLWERYLTYRFPELDIKDKFEERISTDIGSEILVSGEIGITADELTQ